MTTPESTHLVPITLPSEPHTHCLVPSQRQCVLTEPIFRPPNFSPFRLCCRFPTSFPVVQAKDLDTPFDFSFKPCDQTPSLTPYYVSVSHVCASVGPPSPPMSVKPRVTIFSHFYFPVRPAPTYPSGFNFRRLLEAVSDLPPLSRGPLTPVGVHLP